MTYIDYLNDFNRWLESGNLPGGSQLMYFKLLNVFNRAGWPEYVQVDMQSCVITFSTALEKSRTRNNGLTNSMTRLRARIGRI